MVCYRLIVRIQEKTLGMESVSSQSSQVQPTILRKNMESKTFTAGFIKDNAYDSFGKSPSSAPVMSNINPTTFTHNTYFCLSFKKT